MIVTNEELV
jgi:ABC-type maltose transport system permease subunit